jgi:hypothetical protein
MTPLTVQLRQAILGFGPTNVREVIGDVELMNAADPGSEELAVWFAREASNFAAAPLLDPWQNAERLAKAAAAQTIADLLERGMTGEELEQIAHRLEGLRGPVIRATANAAGYRDT